MNAFAEKSRPRAAGPAPGFCRLAALLMLASGAVGGCAEIRSATSLPPVNPESPVAGVVAAAAKQSYPRPSFQSVPPKPLNIPPPYAVKAAVVDMVRCRRSFEAWTSAHPAMVSGTKAFSEGLQARLDTNPADLPTPEEKAASEAEAEKLRAYAEPPPALTPTAPLDASQAAAPSAMPRRRSPRPPTTAIAAAAPAATQPIAVAPSAPPPAPTMVAVASVQPSMAPLYHDPLLAHCQ